MIFHNNVQGEISTKYQEIRDNEYFSEQKDFIELLWKKFKQYADSTFLDQFHKPENFEERFWELYLGSALLNYDLNLSSNDWGPDFKINATNTQYWIEAISAGIGEDEELKDKSRSGKVPTDKIVLRITSALFTKYQKIKSYLDKEVISPNDPVIIAINSSKIDHTKLGSDPPFILRALFSIGNHEIVINPKTGKIIGEGLAQQDEITKTNKNNIKTKYFEGDEFKEISGVLYSNKGPFFSFNKLGADFLFVHNPFAKNNLKKGWLKLGREYYFEEGELKSVDW